MAGRAKQKVGIEAEQAVAAAYFAAFDRFEQEIATPGLDQLERCPDRGLGIGHELAPHERRLARGKASPGDLGVLG